MYRYYKAVRDRNPHIPAWRALEYVKTLKASGTLDKAFPGIG